MTYRNSNSMSNNIIDQPVPKIEIPILKPIKASQTVNQNALLNTADAVQKQLNKFALLAHIVYSTNG